VEKPVSELISRSIGLTVIKYTGVIKTDRKFGISPI
jgi:hypothetical protein